MTVADIMSKHPIALDLGSTVRDVVNILLENDVRHVPILSQGQVIGIVSDRDIQQYMLPMDMQFDDMKETISRFDSSVDEVMQTEVLSVSPSTEVGELIDLLIAEKVGALPVIEADNGTLVGIVSYVDVLRYVREDQ